MEMMIVSFLSGFAGGFAFYLIREYLFEKENGVEVDPEIGKYFRRMELMDLVLPNLILTGIPPEDVGPLARQYADAIMRHEGMVK